jgi:hypothetical protein
MRQSADWKAMEVTQEGRNDTAIAALACLERDDFST